MLRVWNVTLVILTFFLTIFGTFMTRSGVVQSVHAFGEDPELARMFTIFMIDDPGRQLRVRDLPAAAAARAQRARLVGVARSGVPGQQLDPAVLGVLRPVRDDVPDAQRGGHGRAAHRRPAVLQQVDAADRARCCCCSPASGRCSRGASPRSSTCATSSCSRSPSALVVGGRARRARRARLDVGHLLRAVRLRRRARSARSSGAARACARAPPAPTSSRRSSAWSAATSAATAATSSTSASC